MGSVRAGELFPMRLLGFGLYLAWASFVVPFEKAYGVEAFSSSIARLYLYVGLSAALCMACALYVRATGCRPWDRWSVVACAVCGALSPLCDLAALALPVGGAVLDACSIALRAVGGVGLFLQWNEQLAGHKARVAWISYAGSFVLAACVYLVVSPFGTGAVTVATCILPVASGVLLALSRRLPQEKAEVDSSVA